MNSFDAISYFVLRVVLVVGAGLLGGWIVLWLRRVMKDSEKAIEQGRIAAEGHARVVEKVERGVEVLQGAAGDVREVTTAGKDIVKKAVPAIPIVVGAVAAAKEVLVKPPPTGGVVANAATSGLASIPVPTQLQVVTIALQVATLAYMKKRFDEIQQSLDKGLTEIKSQLKTMQDIQVAHYLENFSNAAADFELIAARYCSTERGTSGEEEATVTAEDLMRVLRHLSRGAKKLSGLPSLIPTAALLGRPGIVRFVKHLVVCSEAILERLEAVAPLNAECVTVRHALERATDDWETAVGRNPFEGGRLPAASDVEMLRHTEAYGGPGGARRMLLKELRDGRAPRSLESPIAE